MQVIQAIPNNHDYKLVLNECELPTLGAHDVLIRVRAAGVNRADLFQAEGKYPAPDGASDVLGLEVSGVIEAMGDEVRKNSVGEEVMALLLGGGYAEYVVVPEWRVMSKPKNLSFVEAAGVMETFTTVYQTVFEKAGIRANDWLLVHGGASGIGTSAIQLAKAYGVNVAVTASTDKKCDACAQLGADITINYHEQDFVEVLSARDIRAHVVLDMVGGDYVNRNLKVLNKKGRIVQIAVLGGTRAEVNIAALLMKHVTWIGSTLRSEEEEVIYHLLESMRTTVLPLLENGQITPVIDRVFTLEEASKAHDYLRENQHIGKIILEVNN